MSCQSKTNSRKIQLKISFQLIEFLTTLYLSVLKAVVYSVNSLRACFKCTFFYFFCDISFQNN